MRPQTLILNYLINKQYTKLIIEHMAIHDISFNSAKQMICLTQFECTAQLGILRTPGGERALGDPCVSVHQASQSGEVGAGTLSVQGREWMRSGRLRGAGIGEDAERVRSGCGAGAERDGRWRAGSVWSRSIAGIGQGAGSGRGAGRNYDGERLLPHACAGGLVGWRSGCDQDR